MTRLTNLTTLDLRGNDRLGLPPELLEKNWYRGAQTILHFIEQMQRAQRRPLAEAKMLVVGEGEVGKTSLVKMLVEGRCNPRELKTEGIDIRRWPIEPEGGTVRLNVWDFGGQEILHSTHQFFLTKRSLYLLVLDARRSEQQGRLEYWLRIIESFGGTSPILVVLNRSDEHRLELDRKDLRAKHPGIRAFVETSCIKPFLQASGEKGNGVAQLKEEIEAAVAGLDHVRDALPLAWFAVKEELEAMKERKESYIPHSRYEEMCAAQVIDDDDRRTLIGLLNDLGVVIHYQDDRRLQDTNILNPDWVTQGIYRILNAPALFKSKGVLAMAELGAILGAKAYPQQTHGFIVGMMRKFELCFPFEGEEEYLIPELASKEEPELIAEPDDALGFEYWYPVLPQSVISRFIVRMYESISRRTWWRTGVVLDVDGNKAVVKADLEGARVTIAVHGPERSRRQALAVIRSNFDHIHGTIPGLEPERKVPVPGQDCKPIDYAHLLKLEQKGKETIFPEGAEDEVSVAFLLDGIESREERIQRRDDELAPRPPPPKPPPAPRPAPPAETPWRSGSFYLFTGLSIPAGVVLVVLNVPGSAPVAIPGGVLLFVAVVVAQLFWDRRLKEKGFVQLMSGVIAHARPGGKARRAADEPPEPRARRPLPADRPKELPPAAEAKTSAKRKRPMSADGEKARKPRG